MYLRSRYPRAGIPERSGEGGEGQGGSSFLGAPSIVSKALPPLGLLMVSLTLSAMLVILLTAALAR